MAKKAKAAFDPEFPCPGATQCWFEKPARVLRQRTKGRSRHPRASLKRSSSARVLWPDRRDVVRE
jgi:hypothetical protein